MSCSKDTIHENYFLLHGSFGSPFVNWLPWLRRELRKRSKEVYTPDFPTGVGFQNYANWSKLLKVYLDAGLITEDTIIFAHSIAPIFVCKFLLEHQVKVRRLIFVCGFNNYSGIDPDYDQVNHSMYLEDPNNIKRYCDEIICFYTDNDPYVKYEAEKAFADTVASKQIIIKDGGHLNSESGYREFPELLTYIKE